MFIEFPSCTSGEFVNEIVTISEEEKAHKRALMWEYLKNKIEVNYPVFEKLKSSDDDCWNFIKGLNF